MGNIAYLLYLGAAYDTGVYGACAYQTGCPAGPNDPSVGAPNTGFLDRPEIMVPLILGMAVLIAAIILLTKKIIRRMKG